MSENRRARYDSVVDVSSLAEFVKGYQQQGLKKALALTGPFAINAAIKRYRKGA